MQTTLAENTAAPSPARSGIQDRRAYRRVRVPLKVRFMTADGIDQRARVRTISPAAAVIECDSPPARGQRILLYIDRIGRLEGIVTHIDDQAMRVRFETKRSRKVRNADTLIWLVNRGTQDPSHRRAIRIRQDKAAEACRDDGSRHDCRILDISVTGASVAIEPRPPVGTVMTIGKMRGRVVRHHEAGIGMEFIRSETAPTKTTRTTED